jgi:hypothetical protein
MNSDNLFKALSVYIDAMRPFVVSFLMKNFKDEPWEGILFSRLKPDKQDAWNRIAKSFNKESNHTVLIDYNNLANFAIAFKQELTTELGNPKDVNKLISYFQELQDVRNKCNHYQQLDNEEIDRAFSNMKLTAKLLKMDELISELENIKNKTVDSIEQSVSNQQPKIQLETSSEASPLPSWFNNAIPHYDIRNGTLDESVFAANLGEVAMGVGQEVYSNRITFFEKTYITSGLRIIANRVIQALNGEDTDNRVISLQTGFGGGKTHTLISLYHIAKAGEGLLASLYTKNILAESVIPQYTDAKVAVFTNSTTDVLQGRRIDDKTTIYTLWGELAYQLGGLSGYEKIKDNDIKRVAPTGTLIKSIFANVTPCLILIDELADYCVKASGVDVGAGNLSNQTITFIQTLTEVVSSIPKCVMIATLPASANEVAASSIGQEILSALQSRIVRVGTEIKPVEDEEIFEVVRRRLFEEIKDYSLIEQVLARYKSTYHNRRSDLPDYADRIEYINKIRKSYPFHPELIDMFRLRWGQDSRFQRTRGVLRLLASIIKDLWVRRGSLEGTQALIHTSDVNLINLPTVTGTITSLVGGQWETVMHADVYGTGSNAYKIDNIDPSGNLGKYNLTQGIATTILMASLGNLQNKGITINELKLCVLKPNSFNHNDVNGALNKLEQVAHYLYSLSVGNRSYWFQAKPNINILINQAKSEVSQKDNFAEIIQRLSSNARGIGNLKVLVNPTSDVPEQKSLTLVILGPEYATHPVNINYTTEHLIKKIALNKGNTNRIYRNTILYLVCSETGLSMLESKLLEYLACAKIQHEYNGQLEADQKKDLLQRKDTCEQQVEELLLKAYNIAIKYSATNGVEAIELRNFGKNFYTNITENLINELNEEEWLINGIGLSTLKSNSLFPTIDTPIQLSELYEAFLRFDDKPMISGPEAIIQSIHKYCYNGEFNLAYGEPGKFERIYHKENVPFLNTEEPKYWLVDKSVQNKPKEVLPENSEQNNQNDNDKKDETVSIDDKETAKIFKSIKISGKIPVEQWTNLFSSFVVPLKNNNLEIEVSFKAKTNNLNLLDESSQVYKIVKESAKQLGLNLEEEQ